MSFIKLTDLDLAGKRVLIRADLNVPVKDGKVTSDARITASMPTIEHCMKAVLLSWLCLIVVALKKARPMKKIPWLLSLLTCQPSWVKKYA